MDPEQVARTNGAISKLSEEDAFYVARCEELRQTATSRGLIPGQSNFLVAALITYTEQTAEDHGEQASVSAGSHNHQAKKYVYGLNAEPCTIAGSICAERSCIVQLQMKRVAQIHAIYITTSTEMEVTPGPLCREWLSEICAPETPVVLFTRSTCTSTQLQKFYPFRNLYSCMRASEAAGVARELSPAATALLTEERVHNLVPHKHKHLTSTILMAYKRAKAAAYEYQQGDDYHPLRYAVAIIFEKGEVEIAKQNTCVEYGCTIDAFSKLIKDIERYSSDQSVPVVVLQVDQFGFCHPPPARTRSYMVEFGRQEALTLFHFTRKDTASEMSPRVLWQYTKADSLTFVSQSFENLLPRICAIPFSNAEE